MKNFLSKITPIALIIILTLTACNDNDDTNEMMDMEDQPQTIAQIATADENFSILVDALTRTDLVGVVSDASANLTVFAPTNAAFADLLAELNMSSLDEVETALTTEGLKNVLLYHVLGAEVKSSSVSTGYVATATEDKLSFYVNTSDGVMLNDKAKVTTPDVDASNGVIHVIDKVILPLTINELIDLNWEFSSLQASLEAADGGLDALFADAEAGPYTLFAPNDMAFVDLLDELQVQTLADVIGAIGTDGLSNVLTYHAVSGVVRSDAVPSGTVPTVNGQNITISTTDGVVITDVGGDMAGVIATDIQGTNGVIHVIDEVLMPSL